MKRESAVILTAILLVMVCDIPVISEQQKDPYRVYREYKESLHHLQQDIASIYLELYEQKNPQAVYQHMLQTVENVAVVIGEAEPASQNVIDGLHFSMQGQLELLFVSGLSEEQKTDLFNLGYTEEDLTELMDSLIRYNDYNYHVSTGFTSEQLKQLYALGVTDEQISELEADIRDHYTEIHTYEQMIKESQKELVYIQISLSLAALEMLLEQDHQGNAKGLELQNAEETLLEAILAGSEDQKSLEQVRAFSKHVYKAAEQKIRKGEEQYLVDFFLGLQIHCGALTALNGDLQFGLAEILSYRDVLSACASPERTVSSPAQIGEQVLSPEDSGPTDFVEQIEGGQIEESNEDNNKGWITILIKASDTTDIEFAEIVYNLVVNVLLPWAQQILIDFLEHCLAGGVEVASFVLNVAGVIFILIITAPGVGGEWVHSFDNDPSGTFDEIVIDQDAKEQIYEKAENENLRSCERKGYEEVFDAPGQIVDTVIFAVRLYVSPSGHYFYYMKNKSGSEWAVEVEDMGYGLGRVVEAYKVLCEYGCNNMPCKIFENWELCCDFTLKWSRSYY